MKYLKEIIFSVLTLGMLFQSVVYAQENKVPSSYSNINFDENNRLYLTQNGQQFYAQSIDAKYSIEKLLGNPTGTNQGIQLDFGKLEGSITYGLIPYGQVPHPLPVFRFSKKLNNGKVNINIKDDFKYPYDFVNWKENKFLTIGYRIISNKGVILFDGEVSVKGKGPFTITPAIYEGPFVSNITENSADLWCHTTLPVSASVSINGTTYHEKDPSTFHYWKINGLEPNKSYIYRIDYAGLTQEYHFKTAPKKGSKNAFIFGYASDSRHAKGGGERMIYGTNAYIMKRIAALAYNKNVSFMQFTGDMINGYLTNYDEQQLQYTNWKKAIEPFWHYMPFYIGMGNHEALGFVFKDDKNNDKAFVDGFPYATKSAEAAFAEAFVNPLNGPDSEDGNKYDPNPSEQDFPSYKENVFYYTYGNIAMIVLNSDYWYAPSLKKNTATSGGLHGYIMDNQLQWLRKTIHELEADSDIDHVFVTQHTPVFPNGGHAKDDMWYYGNNEKRPFIAGKPVDYGIIERRDQYLDILINQSSKVVAILTGDEHNYNWLEINDKLPIYPENYPYKKLKISRPIYQINNGAAGAPYYAQEKLPWSKYTRSFSVENALCLFYVEGKKIKMVVLNPDALNEIDQVQLK